VLSALDKYVLALHVVAEEKKGTKKWKRREYKRRKKWESHTVVPYDLTSATPHAGEGIFILSGHK